MLFRLAGIVALIVAALLAAGCNGAKELDEVSYVLTVGADAADGGQLTLTYEVAVPRILSGDPSTTDPRKAVIFATVTAPTLAEGRNLLNSLIARAPNLSHVTTFIIGEDLARRGVADFLGPTMRFREFRGTIDIVVVTGKAKDFMLQNAPEEVLPSRWYQSMLSTGQETGYYLRSSLLDFYVRLKSDSGSPYATLMAINPLSGKGQPGGPPVPGDKTREYLPQDLPRESGNPATVIGTAVFKEDKLVGMLPSEETRMLAMLLGDYPHGFMVVADPLAPQHAVNVELRLGRKPKIDVAVSDKHAIINIQIFLEGDITAIASGINYESDEYKPLLEKQVTEIVRQRMLQMLRRTQQWGADVVDFGYYYRPRCSTDQEFQDLHWNGIYSQAEINVVVTTKLRRNGLMRKTSPMPREDK